MKADFKSGTTDPSGFVLLADYVPQIVQEIRYYSTYNFIGDRIDGYEEPCALLTIEAARALKAVSSEMIVQGYRLKVFDAYRPACAVKHFVLWGIEDQDLRMKPYFYPDLEKQELFVKGYIAKQSSHSRGSTVGAVCQPHAAAARDGPLRLPADRLRMVAFHPGKRAVSGHVFRVPGLGRVSETLTHIGKAPASEGSRGLEPFFQQSKRMSCAFTSTWASTPRGRMQRGVA